MKNLGTKGIVTTLQQEESDIPKIPMPISPNILKNQPERSKREDVEVFCPIDGRVLDNEKPFHKNTRFCRDCGEYRDGIQRCGALNTVETQ